MSSFSWPFECVKVFKEESNKMFCAHPNDTLACVSLNQIGVNELIGIANRNEIVGSFGKCNN